MKNRKFPSYVLRGMSLLIVAIVLGGFTQAQAQVSAYITIQPNATKDAFIHTVSWVALDSQYGGSVYDNPLTTGVNEGDKDFINNNTSFGNFGAAGGSAFEIHSWDDPVGQTRYEFLPGVEVRYQPPHAGDTNSYAGGYVYMGTDGSDGAASSSVGNSTPKWDDLGAFTTDPNGVYGHGWEGVTGFRTVNADGTGTQITNGDGYYNDTDSIDGSAPIDDIGMILVGFDAATQAAPQTGYMQTIIPIATAATSTDDYFTNPNFFNPTALTWTSAYVEGVFTNNASVELTVSSSTTYVAKLAVSGDFDSDLDVDNSDIGLSAGNFTGSAGAGDFFGQYYRDGDTDGDMDIDNADLGAVAGNFTGAAGNLTDSGTIANLIYNPTTGNLTLDASEATGAIITTFQLESLGQFIDANYNSLSGGGFGGAFEDVSDSVLADSDLTFVGFSGTADLGNVLATGLDLTSLEALLTTAVYTGSLGSGQQQFDLVIAGGAPIPTPAALPAGLLALGLLAARRRR